jgi:hypothetical protein
MLIAAVVWALVRARAELEPYRERNCTGPAWRRAFPSAPKAEVRGYLRCFVEAMALPNRYALNFHPSDRVLEVYRALYGGRTPLGDHLECETFLEEVGLEFDIAVDDLVKAWHPDITLGELFAYARPLGGCR